MRQELIAHYRRTASEAGASYEDATIQAIDQADTDIQRMSRSELRVFVNQLRAQKRAVVKDVVRGERFTSRRLMAGKAKEMKDSGVEVLGYAVVTGGIREDVYMVGNNTWQTGRLAQPKKDGFYVVYAIPREL
jgi:hypothetical protein